MKIFLCCFDVNLGEKNECGLVNEDCLQHQRYVLTHKYYYQLCEKNMKIRTKSPQLLLLLRWWWWWCFKPAAKNSIFFFIFFLRPILFNFSLGGRSLVMFIKNQIFFLSHPNFIFKIPQNDGRSLSLRTKIKCQAKKHQNVWEWKWERKSYTQHESE